MSYFNVSQQKVSYFDSGNDFKENAVNTFVSLKKDKDFTDVTLVCEDGKQVEAHIDKFAMFC